MDSSDGKIQRISGTNHSDTERGCYNSDEEDNTGGAASWPLSDQSEATRTSLSTSQAELSIGYDSEGSLDNDTQSHGLFSHTNPAMMMTLQPGGAAGQLQRPQTNSQGCPGGTSVSSSSAALESVLGSSKKTGGSMSELRNFMVEKELIESKLRKLQMEISGLQAENVLLKEKNKRTLARCDFVSAELDSARADSLHQRSQHDNAMSSRKREDGNRYQTTIHKLEAQIIKLTRNVEVSKSKNTTLQRELEEARRTLNVNKPPERSEVINSYKADIKALKEELEKSHDLFRQSEQHRKEESEKRRAASIQIIKLTEMKTLLQQQLENAGGGSVADKQVASLERRLKVTGDRLHQERADRAAKLSDVEEKLINENAKLQVSEKELKKQLKRERDRNNNLMDKYCVARDDNDRLQVELSDKPLILDAAPYKAKMSAIRGSLSSMKHADEVKVIREQIKKEENLGQGQDNDIIWLLWHQKEEVSKQLKEWESNFSNLNVNSSNVKDSLKHLQHEHQDLEVQVKKHKEAVEDVRSERDNLQLQYQKEIKVLVSEKHAATAEGKNQEDISAALKAENEALRISLHSIGGSTPYKPANNASWEAERESLRNDVRNAEEDLRQSVRSQLALDNQIQSLQAQLDSKQHALDNSMATIQHLENTSSHGNRNDVYQRENIDSLQAELQGCNKEVELWQEKYAASEQQRAEIEDEMLSMRQKLSHSLINEKPLQAGEQESDKLGLEIELHEKDSHIMTLTVSYNEIENELMRCKQRHLQEEQHSTDLAEQLCELQAKLRQKTRLMEKMGSTEADHHLELRTLRDNLISVNTQFTECGHQLKVATVDLEREKTRTHKLQTDLTERERQLSQDIAQLLQAGTITSSLYPTSPRGSSDMVTQAEMRVRMVEYEQESLKHDLERANAAIQSMVTENTDLTSQISVFRQELGSERAQVFQLATAKAELEQKLHVLSEERDGATRQRVQLEQDLLRQESHMRETIQRLEEDAAAARVNYQQKYYSLDTEGKKMAVELETNKRLVEGRNKEIDVLRDTLFRQKQEVATLQRHVDVLGENNQSCLSEVDRLNKELAQKMKEVATAVEMHQSVSSQHSKLQKEKLEFEREVESSRGDVQHHVIEVADLRHQLENVSEKLTITEKRLSDADVNVPAMEVEANKTKQALETMETRHKEAMGLVKIFNKSVDSTLLHAEQANGKKRLQLEKLSRSTLRDELNYALHQMELIRQEIDLYSETINSERLAISTLKDHCHAGDEYSFIPEDPLKAQTLEMDALRSHLENNRVTSQEKQTLYQDIQEIFRVLSERNEMIKSLQHRNKQLIENVRHESNVEKTFMVEEKIRLEGDLSRSRSELSESQRQLQNKELQLTSCLKTSVDVQAETRAKVELEEKVSQLQIELSRASWQNVSLQSDNTRLQDDVQRTKEECRRHQAEITTLKDDLRDQQNEYSREMKVMQVALNENSQKYDMNKGSLKADYQTVLADLRAAEVSLTATKEAKQLVMTANQQLEISVQDLKAKLSEEVTARKLMEQNTTVLKSQLTDTRDTKLGVDERITELQVTVQRQEGELSTERQKYIQLKKEVCSRNTTSLTQEQYYQSLHLQMAEVQAEKTNLQHQMETNKQNLMGNIRRLQLELKQQTDDYDQERTKLIQQLQQLSRDLEQTREQVAAKSRDNLHLQEGNLGMEVKVREAQRTARQVQDGLKAEEDRSDMLERRVMESELLLAKLRGKDCDESSYEATRSEVTRMLSELSQRMQSQLGHQRETETEAHARDMKRLEELKKKILLLEASLSQEQAIHIITKTQAQSLEDDNQRLRQQLQVARKRITHSNEPERTKTRLEEINEIIVRSQMRAQQLLASGTYDDPHRTMSPIRDLRSPITNYLAPQLLGATPDFNLGTNGTVESANEDNITVK